MKALRKHRSKGFTLLELIVVVVILGLLAAIAIPTFARVISRTHDATTLTTLQVIGRDAQAINAFSGESTWDANSVATAISETSYAAAGGAWAEGSLSPVEGDTVPSEGVVTYQVKTSGPWSGQLQLSMLSSSGKVCISAVPLTGAVSGECVTLDPESQTPGQVLDNGDVITLPPNAPQPYALTLDVTAGQDTARLSWNLPEADSATVPESFTVYTGTSVDGPWSVKSVLDPTASAFVDTGLLTGTHCYQVVVQPDTSKLDTKCVSVVNPPSVPFTPSNFTATPQPGAVALSWSNPAVSGRGVSGYKVYRDGALLASLNTSGTTTYTDMKVMAGTSYNYEVTAIYFALESDRSAPVSVAPVNTSVVNGDFIPSSGWTRLYYVNAATVKSETSITVAGSYVGWFGFRTAGYLNPVGTSEGYQTFMVPEGVTKLTFNSYLRFTSGHGSAWVTVIDNTTGGGLAVNKLTGGYGPNEVDLTGRAGHSITIKAGGYRGTYEYGYPTYVLLDSVQLQ